MDYKFDNTVIQCWCSYSKERIRRIRSRQYSTAVIICVKQFKGADL